MFWKAVVVLMALVLVGLVFTGQLAQKDQVNCSNDPQLPQACVGVETVSEVTKTESAYQDEPTIAHRDAWLAAGKSLADSFESYRVRYHGQINLKVLQVVENALKPLWKAAVQWRDIPSTQQPSFDRAAVNSAYAQIQAEKCDAGAVSDEPMHCSPPMPKPKSTASLN